MERIATDTYSFADIRHGGFVYVDKTANMKTLVDGSLGKQFFIARPRRFGKSLAISTFQCLFEGRRELFKGLAIEPEWDWSKTYPVLKLDMGSCQADTVPELKRRIREVLSNECVRNGIPYRDDENPATAFERTINDLAARGGGRIVLLVDEYDKPLLGHLGKEDVNDFRDALKAFYSVIKTCEGMQRFAFITGVSKFSKVSIFSDLNNLTDISMSAVAATLLGYTHDEVKKYFPDWIEKLGNALGMMPEDAFAEIVKWYDGYKFHHAAEPVINPVSLGLCLKDSEFRTYWSSTAVPTFLVDLLKDKPLNLQLTDVEEEFIGTYEPDCPNVIPLLFQTGYLTIKGFCNMGGWRTYSLGFPNMEVRNSFNARLARAYVGDGSGVSTTQMKCLRALIAGDLETFFSTIKVFFANIPYDISSRAPEETYQAVFCAILYFIGVGVTPEVHTNEGSIDAVMETPDHVYVMEFKRDKSAAEALAQIKEKNYCEKFLGSGKKITLIGINFDSEKRNFDEWTAEAL